MANPTTPSPPLSFLVALFPGFQLLDVCGPLDMFNFLPQPPYNVPISMKIIASTPAGTAVSTKLIPGTLPGEEQGEWSWDVASALGLKDESQVNRKWDQKMVVDASFEDILEEVKGGKGYDVLFVPGGVGTRVRRLDTKMGRSELAVQGLVQFIKEVRPFLRLGIMTVCTGSDVLGYTGLIDGRRATTNMSRFDDVSGRHQRVKWVKGARWVKSGREEDKEEEGKGIEVWTSAGVSAGMDAALAFIAEKFGGVEVARDIAKKSECEYLTLSSFREKCAD